jgi:hypothetical protein
MSPSRKKLRWSLLAVGLVLSAGVGGVLGRAYERRLEAESSTSPGEDTAELLAEALDLDTARPKAEAGPAGTARLPEGLGQLERTGQATLRARMPVPPGAGPLITIGTRLDAHGVPMNLASYETQLRVEDVLGFYARHFEARGWPYSDAPGARELVPYPALSATLFEEELQLTVMVMPHGEDRGNTVVLGLADMAAWKQGLAKEDTGDLPVYPGTQPVAVRARDEGLAALTVSFDTPDALATVEDFYRKALAERGYREVADAPEAEGAEGPRLLRFASRGRAWELALSTQGQGTAVTAHSAHQGEATP